MRQRSLRAHDHDHAARRTRTAPREYDLNHLNAEADEFLGCRRRGQRRHPAAPCIPECCAGTGDPFEHYKL